MVKTKSEITRLKHMEKVMRMFTHDLRNPLLNIQALIQDMNMTIDDARSAHSDGKKKALSTALDKELPEVIQMLHETSSRMDDIILGANEISHCMFDDLECESLDMHDMFLRCFALLKLADQALELHCSFMPNVYADPWAVKRIINEILSNAGKAIAVHKGCAKQIIIEANEADGFVYFQVEDFGCGFEEDNIPHVFEPFFSSSQFGKALGLGLTRVQALVEHHGGKVTVGNKENNGATITFSLPKV